jgi:Family of unknown function (DUF5908)
MPILIRELHIKVAVNAPAQQGNNANVSTQIQNTGPNGQTRNEENRELVIAECVEQVLEILKAKNEP